MLSSFKPITVLKGKFSASKKGAILRKGLVIGQFAITVALIIGSFVVYRQIRYMNQQDLGLNIDQMLILKTPMLMDFESSFIVRENSFKEEVKHIAGVQGATTSNRVAGGELSRTFNVHRTDDNSGIHYSLRISGIDYDILSVYGLKLLAGRNFTPADN